MTAKERDQIERLRRLRHKSTRTSAVRFAVAQALFIAEAEEQKKQFAIVDADGRTVLVHFVM